MSIGIQLPPPQVPLEASRVEAASTYINDLEQIEKNAF